jgi:hypothetical protein
MWLYDFDIFYRAGKMVLTGGSPYAVPGFFSPLPLAVLFAPLALLPKYVAYGIYVLVSLWLLWRQARQRMLWAALSFPVLFTLFVGQVDLAVVLCLALFGPLALPVVLIKPQAAFVAIPWILRHSSTRALLVGLLLLLAVLSLCFFLRPNWIGEWRESLPSLEGYGRRDSSLYWLLPTRLKGVVTSITLPAAVGLALLLRERSLSWATVHLFSPVTNIYSAAVLSEWIDPIAMLLSWVAILFVGGNIHNGAPMFVVGLAIIVRRSQYGRLLWYKAAAHVKFVDRA